MCKVTPKHHNTICDVMCLIILKNLKVKQKALLECQISFDFCMRILLSLVGNEKAVGFFSLAHNGVSEVSQACGRGMR